MAGAAMGVILSLEARYSLARFGAKSMFPATLVYSVIQVMGPVITGLVVSGRVGAGMGAELASMKVTEQIDAIEASAINPYRLLAATRILACILDASDADPRHRCLRVDDGLVRAGVG